MSSLRNKTLEASGFIALAGDSPLGWMVLGIQRSHTMGANLDVLLSYSPIGTAAARIHFQNVGDYAIRPQNPAIIEGGPPMRLINEDPSLLDPRLQYVPGGDGETYDPPRVYQRLELGQTWIIAERFFVEVLDVFSP